jgi:hypothetical protein
MKLSRTTLTGTLSAVCFAAALAPGLPTVAATTFSLCGCVCLAFFGSVSSDCPANCPGTDADGKPSRQPKLPLILLAIVGPFLLLALLCNGCVTRNPGTGPSQPGQPAFIVSPQLSAASNTVAQLAQTAGAVTNTGPLIPTAANGIFLAIAAISALIAQHKNQVAATIAAGVAKAGPATVQAVLNNAADSAKFSAVAGAINDQLAAGQSPGQPTPART